MTSLHEQSPAVLVVGDLILDHYVLGETTRISPEAAVPVVDVRREASTLGGAGNVAANLAALGARVTVGSVIGQDPAAATIAHRLAALGAAADAVIRDAERVTSLKTRVVASRQQIVRFDQESRAPITARQQADLLERLLPRIAAQDALLISDYAKGVVVPEVCRVLIDAAREHGIPVLVDPKGSDGSKYRGATLLSPNRKEAAELSGIATRDEAAVREAGRKLRASLQLDAVLVTLSEDGMAIIDSGFTRIGCTAREVCDVSGAGDTVLASLGFGLACGLPLREAAEFASAAAGIVVGKAGVATVTLDEVLEDLRARAGDDSQRLQTPQQIERTAESLRRQGRRIVFTNGCFDLLHRGHVEYLRASRACGDVLIVGLNSDASVRRLKGEHRPVVPEADRSAILAALESVDYVVCFDEDTPAELIRRIRPDVLTKGADYQPHEVVGREWAGELRLIPLTSGRSTSQTIRRILAAA